MAMRKVLIVGRGSLAEQSTRSEPAPFGDGDGSAPGGLDDAQSRNCCDYGWGRAPGNGNGAGDGFCSKQSRREGDWLYVKKSWR